MDIFKEVAKHLGSRGGQKTAQTHSKEYYQAKAKHMNEVRRRKKEQLQQTT